MRKEPPNLKIPTIFSSSVKRQYSNVKVVLCVAHKLTLPDLMVDYCKKKALCIHNSVAMVAYHSLCDSLIFQIPGLCDCSNN
jgi:hypothetical protein